MSDTSSGVSCHNVYLWIHVTVLCIIHVQQQVYNVSGHSLISLCWINANILNAMVFQWVHGSAGLLHLFGRNFTQYLFCLCYNFPQQNTGVFCSAAPPLCSSQSVKKKSWRRSEVPVWLGLTELIMTFGILSVDLLHNFKNFRNKPAVSNSLLITNTGKSAFYLSQTFQCFPLTMVFLWQLLSILRETFIWIVILISNI